MASSGDSWDKEYNDVVKLADDIEVMISERNSVATGPEAQRQSSTIWREITILTTRLESLQSILSKVSGRQPLIENEQKLRKDMLANLKLRVTQMAYTLNMSNFANRDSTLGPEIKSDDATSRASGLDNHGVIHLQRQIMKEQDEGLDSLAQTVESTKHIMWAINEELSLQTRLIDDYWDEHGDIPDPRLQRVEKRLAIINKRTRGGCSCLWLMLSVLGIAFLVALIYLLIKYL